MDAGPSRAVMLYGTELEDPPARLLRAGPLSVEFENYAQDAVGGRVLRTHVQGHLARGGMIDG